jgi:arylsulfatase A-like enzyme
MKKTVKGFLIALGIVLVIVAAGAIWFHYNWYRLPKIMASINNPTHDNRPVEWKEGPELRTSDLPNVIVILVDDLGFNEISAYGGGMADGAFMTPNIDQMATEGVLCTNGYSATAVCSPSRASLLTGRFSTRFGYEFTPTSNMGKFLAREYQKSGIPSLYDEEIGRNLPPMKEMGLPTSEVTIPEMLKSKGYHSVHVGKWHLGGSEEFMPVNHGFDESLWVESGSMFLPEKDPDVVNAKLPFDLIDKFLWANLPYAVQFNDGPRFEPDGYLTDYFTNEAVNVIEKNKNQPFFLYLAYWAVHTPLQALKSDYDALSFIEDHAERVQASMVRAVDRGVGKIRQALKDHGLLENTLIIFTSDNGAPHYIGLPNVNKPYRGWKLSFFEGGIHIPFIVSHPGALPQGEYQGRVSSVDLFKTIGTLAGASMPTDRKLDGTDILPYLRGEMEGEPERPLFFKDGTYAFVIKDGWKLQMDNMTSSNWLFDLNQDPTEQQNLIEEESLKRNEMTTLLEEFIAEQAKPLWEGALHAPVTIDKHLNEPFYEDGDIHVYWQN